MAGASNGAIDMASPRHSASRFIADLFVAGALAFVLCAIYLWDARLSSREPPALPNPELVATPSEPPTPPAPPALPKPPPIDPTPRVAVQTTPDGRFGLTSLSGNPDDSFRRPQTPHIQSQRADE